ncbi:type II toxin-antitoxin system RatA family toxin [Roseospira marina]|uniref:Type II toxin-antitoxin system RatA family toxin n=1 Tax=Roseospira marina TaxID=140057 RepID=A0A5M6IEF1_9PROT|nr:type II toxin-antitoxin system RatA family toxin [Roseospira marina]KAA5606633.1 type II toxin-antitoxin system RatA family toxin [Roseospira marina]MBB4313962.1 coenzyme Q-binding protein COQ10 [Roseospira marina]MBB5087124.1 coenzyme Q-binding protein COQ10 [Roseospira marina]
MKQSVQRVVPHERERVFDLVADVEAYPSFLPLWKSARVLDRDPTGYRTRQLLGIGPATLEFISRTDLAFPDRITVTATGGPVRRLYMLWAFEAMDGGRCRVGLDLAVEVHSKMLQKLLQATYGEMAPRLITAFEGRARAVERGAAQAPPPAARPGPPAGSSPGVVS